MKKEFSELAEEILKTKNAQEIRELYNTLKSLSEKQENRKRKKDCHVRWGSKKNYTVQMQAVIPKKGENPFPSYISFFLSTRGQDSVGKITLTPQMITVGEVKAETDRLIKNIQQVQKEAKKVLEIWGFSKGSVIYYEEAQKKPSWLQKGR